MTAPCDGLRVIDFSTWMAGPLATMVLADNGAGVIKVEPPDGDPARSLPAFQTWNRGKQSVVLDLKTEGGQERALRLLESADIAVTSFRPGVAERLGIGYERLRELNPRLVYATITGYGEGRWRGLKGYDALVTARSGRMMMFERVADRPGPAFPALPCASYTAGMLAVQGILAALHRRSQTGAGQRVGVSLLAALMPYDLIMWIGWQLRGQDIEAEGQTAPMILQKLLGERPQAQPAPGGKAGAYDPKQLHRPAVRVPRPNYLTAVTKDGVWLQFANTMDHLCVAQMTALDLLDLYGQERFAKLPAVFNEDDAEELWATVLERVRTKTYEEWTAIFEGHADLAVERIRGPLESLEHRQVAHNGHVMQVPGLDGKPTLQPGPLARFSAYEPAPPTRAPDLGEHTQEVLASLGGANARPPSPAPGRRAGGEGGPLAGITVIDFSAWIAAPYATSVLATLGARVIKVEQVGGDMSRYSTGGLLSFPMTQGKQSIALDLKSAEGLRIAQELIARADVLVHNFRAGVLERLGIDYETCRKLNPRLIYLNAASYGDSGPDCRRPMFFATAAAIGGNQLRQVGAGHPLPRAQDLPIADLKQEAWRLLKAAEGNADPIAAMGAATAVLLALHARDRTGEGQSVLTTMICSDMYANSDEAIAYEGRPASPSVDADLLGFGPFHRLYESADGWVFLACQTQKERQAFCVAIERPDLLTHEAPASPAHGSGSGGEGLAPILRTRSTAEWEQLAAARDIPLVAVEMRDPGRFNMNDPVMREQGCAVQVESPVHGQYWRHGALYQFSDETLTFGAWEPLGGHTRVILEELGRTPEQIGELLAAKLAEEWLPETAR